MSLSNVQSKINSIISLIKSAYYSDSFDDVPYCQWTITQVLTELHPFCSDSEDTSYVTPDDYIKNDLYSYLDYLYNYIRKYINSPRENIYLTGSIKSINYRLSRLYFLISSSPASTYISNVTLLIYTQLHDLTNLINKL